MIMTKQLEPDNTLFGLDCKYTNSFISVLNCQWSVIETKPCSPSSKAMRLHETFFTYSGNSRCFMKIKLNIMNMYI